MTEEKSVINDNNSSDTILEFKKCKDEIFQESELEKVFEETIDARLNAINELKKVADNLGFAIVEKNFYERIGKYIYLNTQVLEIIRQHKLLNYVIKNPKCAAMYHLTEEEMNVLKQWKDNGLKK